MVHQKYRTIKIYVEMLFVSVVDQGRRTKENLGFLLGNKKFSLSLSLLIKIKEWSFVPKPITVTNYIHKNEIPLYM